ncbi:TPA: LysR family transcriptional regulator [Klebsiella quasipneumoniae subsp. similipneumoniae]|nr:LysR family transcriptional regulator [Klebsiella quasipneumoniae subsp. similipneumoniae]HDK5920545.1 LysR family transcriptional regulator [Klebsiella quasipneumoniae]
MLKDFKMDELRILCAIAETASVSRAAQRLNMPQSNVSRTLTRVERKVGLAIFLRTARELVRTEFGEQFIHASSAVLAQHEQLINLADRYKNTLQGVVTLGAPIGIHQFLGRYILPALRKTLPELQINLVTRNASEREQKYGAIFNSDCDLLISPFKPQNENLIARPFTRFRTGVFASPDYLAQHPIAEPEALVDHECITLRMLGGSDNIWTFKSKNGKPLNLTVKGGFVCDNTLPAVELAKLGMGIVYAPYYSLATELAAGQLVPCLKKEHCIDLQAWLIYQRRDILPLRVQALLDGLSVHIKNLSHLLL